MRKLWLLLLILATGCSTHPCADLLDYVRPGRMPQAPRYSGGVGNTSPVPPPGAQETLPLAPGN